MQQRATCVCADSSHATALVCNSEFLGILRSRCVHVISLDQLGALNSEFEIVVSVYAVSVRTQAHTGVGAIEMHEIMERNREFLSDSREQRIVQPLQRP